MEGEGLNTLVVYDTGYLGGFVGNYVLEKEGREVDECFEDATKVVGYGVRYASDPMEGEFIILSKWIPSWMLLINGRVKDSIDV